MTMYDSLKEQERACKTLPSSETFDVFDWSQVQIQIQVQVQWGYWLLVSVE